MNSPHTPTGKPRAEQPRLDFETMQRNASDAVSLLGHLFLGSGRPPDPFGACGPDPTADGLECEMFGICE